MSIFSKEVHTLIVIGQKKRISRAELAKELGYTATQSVYSTVNKLIENGLVTEDHNYYCPHCNEVIETMKLTSGTIQLILTMTGKTQYNQLAEIVKKTNGIKISINGE